MNRRLPLPQNGSIQLFFPWSVQEQVGIHLPWEIHSLSKYHPWAVARGYLMQGVRAAIWDRPNDAREYFSRVDNVQEQFDESLLQWLTSHLLAHETEYGTNAVSCVLNKLSEYLDDLGIPNVDHELKGYYYANRAFENFHQGHYHEAQTSVLRAIFNFPMYLRNKGLLSVFLHSMPLVNMLENIWE